MNKNVWQAVFAYLVGVLILLVSLWHAGIFDGGRGSI